MRCAFAAAMGCLVVATIHSAASASAPPKGTTPPRREGEVAIADLAIAELHLGDSIAAVNARLASMNFVMGDDAYPRCERDYESTLRELRKANASAVEPSTLDCTQIHSRGDETVTAQYLLGQRGYVLSGLLFDSRSDETAAAGIARLSRLYGKPSLSEDGITYWYTGVSKRQPYIQYGRTGDLTTVFMTGSQLMSDVFYKEFDKLLRR